MDTLSPQTPQVAQPVQEPAPMPQAQQSAPPTPPIHSRKKLYIGVGIVIILLIVCGLFLLFRKPGYETNMRKIDEGITPTPKLTLKTLTVGELRFTYPSSWAPDPARSNIIITERDIKGDPEKLNPGKAWIEATTSGKPVNELIPSNGESKTDTILISGIEATRTIGDGIGIGGSTYFQIIIIPHGAESYILRLYSQDTDLKEVFFAEFEAIIKTLTLSSSRTPSEASPASVLE